MRFVVVGAGFAPAKLIEMLLADDRATLAGIFTDPDDPRRLRTLADRAGLEIADVRALAADAGRERLVSIETDWLLNANSTVLLSSATLEAPRRGALNLHPGLLPEYAGLHVHQWAIRNGESEFGATIHHMSPALDTGDIAAVARLPIEPTDTGLSLFQRCMDAGIALLGEVVGEILSGKEPERIPQDLTRRHVYRHRDAVDGRIDWSWSARRVVDFVRAGNYEPFRSPTYTATLDAPGGGGEPPTVLAASAVEAAPGSAAGELAGWRGDSPVVATGNGEGVQLDKGRLGRALLARRDWEAYFDALPGRRLRGREDG